MKDNFKKHTDNEVSTNERINYFVEKFIQDREKAKNIVKDNVYMLWLEKFTTVYSGFSDDNWLYCPEKISADDLANVNSLSFFFEGITEYASKNFFPIYTTDWGKCVLIKFNGIGYKVGLDAGQGSISYCERIDISDDKVFIDFNDIMTDKKQDKVDLITQKLYQVEKLIEELIHIGAPIETVFDNLKSMIGQYPISKL